MEIRFDVPIYTDVATLSGLSRVAIMTVPVKIDVPEFSENELTLVISFDTCTNISDPVLVRYTTASHAYFKFRNNLYKVHTESVDGGRVDTPSYTVDPKIMGESIFYKDAFIGIQKMIGDKHLLDRTWGSNNIEPGEVGGAIDARSFDKMRLQDINSLSFSRVNFKKIEEQVSKFKKYMGNFILVDGDFFRRTSTPLVELLINKGKGFDIKFCESHNGFSPFEFIDNLESQPMDREMFTDLNGLQDIIKNKKLSLESYVFNVDAFDVASARCNASALSALNKAIAMIDTFDKSCDLFKRDPAQLVKENSLEKLVAYKMLLSAIENANFHYITDQLKRAINMIAEYYDKNIDDEDFGSHGFVKKAVAMINGDDGFFLV